MSFGIEDAQNAHFLHNDALIITLEVANFMVCRLLVDNIIFSLTLEVMGIGRAKLEKSNSALIRFDGKETSSFNSIKFSVTTGGITQLTTFLVIDSTLAYNAILGIPWIYAIKVVPSTLY